MEQVNLNTGMLSSADNSVMGPSTSEGFAFLQVPLLAMQGQVLTAGDGVSIVEGKEIVGGQLQRTLDNLKGRSKTGAGEAYGTVCTK